MRESGNESSSNPPVFKLTQKILAPICSVEPQKMSTTRNGFDYLSLVVAIPFQTRSLSFLKPQCIVNLAKANTQKAQVQNQGAWCRVSSARGQMIPRIATKLLAGAVLMLSFSCGRTVRLGKKIRQAVISGMKWLLSTQSLG